MGGRRPTALIAGERSGASILTDRWQRGAGVPDGLDMRDGNSEIRIGISGWTYTLWRGNFYPSTLPHKRELAYASRRFNSIEINGTHYSLQRPSSFGLWDAATPKDFVFAVKGSRYITHMLKLSDVEVPLANFFAS